MSRESFVAGIVSELGAAIGLPDLALDETGRVSLLLDGVPLTLTYETDPLELLWLLVDLGEVDTERAGPLRALLQMGFLTWSANRLTIGLTDDGRVVGHTVVPVVNLDRFLLEEVLRHVLETAKAVRERVARGEPELSVEAEQSSPPGPPDGIRA